MNSKNTQNDIKNNINIIKLDSIFSKKKIKLYFGMKLNSLITHIQYILNFI